MKSIKKSLSFIVLAMALCFTFAFSAKVNAEEIAVDNTHSLSAEVGLKAGVSVLSRNYFELSEWNVTGGYINVAVAFPNKAVSMQVQLQNANKSALKTWSVSQGSGIYKCSYSSLAKNKIYYYRARARYSGGKWGSWSYRRAFSTVTPSFTKAGSYAAYVKAPKVTGVKRYDLWMSATSSSKGFKKIGSVKPGSSTKVSKFNGRTLKSYGSYHNFYFFLKPYLKSGATDGVYARPGIYFYTTYK